jgi:cell division protein FtsB
MINPILGGQKMPDHRMDTNAKRFKSPFRKLAYFFEQSRNRWKSKYKETKSSVKRLENKNRYLKKRNIQLKEKVKNLESELNQIRVSEKQLKQSVMKKKR